MSMGIYPEVKINEDGSVTYWSVYDQAWSTASTERRIPDHEYAAMSHQERERVLAHFRALRAAEGVQDAR